MKRLQKETPTQVFSGEICEIIDYTFFYRTLRWLLLIYDRSVFGALSNTYDETFSRNSLQLKAPLTFSQISSIIDKYEILNAKL